MVLIRSVTLLLVAQCLSIAQRAPGPFWAFRAEIDSHTWTETGVSKQWKITFSRASDGSYVYENGTEEVTPDGTVLQGRFRYILDVQRATYASTSPFLKAVMVMPLEASEVTAAKSDYGDCRHLTDGSWQEVGRSAHLGFAVIEVIANRTRMWVAPDLQCFALRTERAIDGQMRLRDQATAVVVGEPNHGEFDIPAGYVMLSPMEMEKRFRAKFGGRSMWGSDSSAARIEERYRRQLEKAKQRRQ